MPNARLLAIVTVLLNLGGGALAQTSFTIDQLREVERLIDARNCSGLRTYLAVNPGLTAGNDALSLELRRFLTDVDQGLIDCLAQDDNGQTARVTIAATPTDPY